MCPQNEGYTLFVTWVEDGQSRYSCVSAFGGDFVEVTESRILRSNSDADMPGYVTIDSHLVSHLQGNLRSLLTM